jgi:hypothetical protein
MEVSASITVSRVGLQQLVKMGTEFPTPASSGNKPPSLLDGAQTGLPGRSAGVSSKSRSIASS